MGDVDLEVYGAPDLTYDFGAAQNLAVQNEVDRVTALGAGDIRVNQQQVNIDGDRVGINRPDLPYTLDGQRHYVEGDRTSSNRGEIHRNRILANDPLGNMQRENLD